MNTTVKGHVFIVPNIAETFKSYPEDSQDWLTQRISRMTGINPKKEDKMLQVWITSKECDNWNDHFGGFQVNVLGQNKEYWSRINETKEDRLLGYFPRLYPSQIFEGKHEGDKVMLHCPEYDVDIELTCNQLDYRYGKFGRFEEVFGQVV